MLEFFKARATLIVFLLGVAATIGFGAWCYDKGKAVERSDWQKKENTELKEKNEQLVKDQATILKLQGERDTAQKALADKLADNSARLQEDLIKNDDDTESTIDRLLSDNKRLQLNLRLSEAESATAQLTATALGRYASGQARLSDEAVRFFGREAGRANAIALRLGQCQATITDYYEQTNQYNKKYFGNDAKF